MFRMPKKTKQYGWQCSECDKGDPSVALATPQAQTVDLEAPRASRARGNTSRLGSSVLSAYLAANIALHCVEHNQSLLSHAACCR